MRAQIYETIQDIDPQTWNTLLENKSITFSHAFWQVIEESKLNDFQYRHVIFFDDDDQPIGQTTFYIVTTDIAIFAQPWLRKKLEWVRRVFPNFLKIKMLECGTPIILNSPPINLHPDLESHEVIDHLHDVLKQYAAKNSAPLIILRDFETKEAHWADLLKKKKYHWIEGLPNTYLDIHWKTLEDYHADLKSYYRSKINNHLKKNKELDVRHDMVDEFQDISEELCRQWLIVHERANEFQREVLTPDFYRKISSKLDGHAKILRFFKGEKFIGHALLLEDGKILRWLYFGRTEPINNSLYLYVIQAVIQAGIELQAEKIEMGLTTYPIKLDVGAQPEAIHFAIQSPISLLNPLIGWGYRFLNKPAAIEGKQVFKTSAPKI